MISTRAEHREFLNRYYGVSRPLYDLTRKYYLFGRDRALRALAADRGWRRLVEVGPGTGRNLVLLHRARPEAWLGGVEASDEMLAHARARCPWASIQQGFAEEADLLGPLGGAPDRILFSYCLSMVQDPAAALANARRSLTPGGQVVVVDFADLTRMPRPFVRVFRPYLRAFHVRPLDNGILAGAARLEYGPGRYYAIATLGAENF